MENRNNYSSAKPTTRELINVVNTNFVLEYNTLPKDRECLFIIVEKFRLYILKRSHGSGFFVADQNERNFPWKDYKETLTYFLEDDRLWRNETLNQYLKHEHLCVLFYIAALRYTMMPKPLLQTKYGKLNDSQNPHTDLFLSEKSRHGEPKVAYAVQIKVLTKKDIDKSGNLKPDSDRFQLDLNTFDKVREAFIKTAKEKCEDNKTHNSETDNYVICITPFNVTWDLCGSYDETIRSEFIDLAILLSQGQNSINSQNLQSVHHLNNNGALQNSQVQQNP